MRIRTLIHVAILGGATVLVAGCGGGGGSSAVATGPAIQPPFVDMFGTGFGTDFQTSANATPPVPTASDIIPLSLTTEPIALH